MKISSFCLARQTTSFIQLVFKDGQRSNPIAQFAGNNWFNDLRLAYTSHLFYI
jgi:hypothetical protein